MRTYRLTGRSILLAVILVAALFTVARDLAAQNGRSVEAPYFDVDPLWPKPLPNHWLLGSTIGVSVDERDHVWIIHRGSATLDDNEKGIEIKRGECCAAAPPVLEFDQDGNLVSHWGGPGKGYEWPVSNHGITVDHRGNVWIGGNGDKDSQVLKFTKSGAFVKQFGKSGARLGKPDAKGQPTYVGGSQDKQNFGRVAKIFVDPRANEAYLADGYLNKRVAVIDADSGVLKRAWGAYGNTPNDANAGDYKPDAPPAPQFRNPVHCADLSTDGFVYVCDRVNNRLQVFQKDGKFVREAMFAKGTLGAGAVWDIAFSRDPAQRFIYLADGLNMKVRVVRRDTLEEVTSFGDGGRQPGQFYGVHSIATDSRGNIYTTETYEGKRVQRFMYRGLRNVTKRDQGTVWPR